MKKFLISIMMLISQLSFAGVAELTQDNYASEITQNMKNGRAMVIAFYADWCGYCKEMAPVYTEVERRLGSKATFVKVNVEKIPELSRDISGIPTIIVVKEMGQNVKPIVGLKTADQLQKEIEAQLK